MAVGKKKKHETELEPRKGGEVIGILIILGAILLTLALVSYNASDPSLQTVSKHSPTNLVGKAGSYIAAGLLEAFGYGSYWLPVILIFFSYFYFTGNRWQIKVSQVIGYLVFMTSFCAFLRLVSDSKITIKSGGILGSLSGDLLDSLFGRIGSYSVVFALFFISLVITVNLRFSTLAGWVRKAFILLVDKLRRKQAEPAEELGIRKGKKTPIIHGLRAAREKKAPEPKPGAKTDAPPGPEPKPRPEPEPAPKPVRETPKSAKVKVIAPVQPQRPEPATQIEFAGFTGTYQPPALELLEDFEGKNREVKKETLIDKSRILEKKLASFSIDGRVLEVHPGPVITTFEFEPAAGIKVSQIANRDDDIAMALRAESIRIVAPIPGKGVIGIEIPNTRREVVMLRELFSSKVFQESKANLAIAMGRGTNGNVKVYDLTKMPHLLIAGTTGAGKSVFMNTLILSLLYRHSPNQMRMLMVDPKMLELSDYAGIPHLLHPVVTDPKRASAILRWAVEEMEDRYRKMAEMGVRNIDNYNEKVKKILEGKQKHPAATILDQPDVQDAEPLTDLPYIVIFIDELADLMIVAAKEVEDSITRLAQMARAAGIHLVLATQRPSVDVITGVIKANFPARISFKVSSKVDSRTILDYNGAENLLGNGDMLFLPPTSSKIERIHGAFVTEEEIQGIVDYLRQIGGPKYDRTAIRAGEEEGGGGLGEAGLGSESVDEELVEQAWEIIRREKKASISYIQRRMKIGYNKAASIIEILEARGFISPSDGTSRPREILVPLDDEEF